PLLAPGQDIGKDWVLRRGRDRVGRCRAIGALHRDNLDAGPVDERERPPPIGSAGALRDERFEVGIKIAEELLVLSALQVRWAWSNLCRRTALLGAGGCIWPQRGHVDDAYRLGWNLIYRLIVAAEDEVLDRIARDTGAVFPHDEQRVEEVDIVFFVV